jgi:hypothetical protein
VRSILIYPPIHVIPVKRHANEVSQRIDARVAVYAKTVP